MGQFSRRDLIKGTGYAGVAAVVGGAGSAEAQQNGQAQSERANAGTGAGGSESNEVLAYLSSEEARFVEAAVSRLIPADDQWGGAVEAGVVFYIDRQLASAYGAGARLYLDGPWDPEAPYEQGYQLKYTPAELYRVGISDIRDQVKQRHDGKEFWDLGANDIDEVLTSLEHGQMQLPSMPSTVFFETLLANTIEGYFADPIYGGNRDMVAWRMVGFPGAYAQYLGLVDQHGFEFKREPIGISNADAVLGHEQEQLSRNG